MLDTIETTSSYPPSIEPSEGFSGGTLVEQYRLEMEMLDGGMERFRKQEEAARKRGDAGVGGRYFLRRLLDPLIVGVEQAIKLANSGKAGRRHSAIPYLQMTGAEVSAYVALRTTLNALSTADHGSLMIQSLAIRVGRAVETELWMRRFRVENKELFTVTMAEVSEHTADQQRHLIARTMARRADIEGEWPERRRLLVGLKLVEMVKDFTGIIAFVREKAGTKEDSWRVSISPAAAERMEEVRAAAAELSPSLMPTIIPPKPWTSTKSGGYHSGLFKRLRLVKTWSNEHLEELDNLGMGEVLSAVNAVQNTPWRVNVRVLEVVEQAIATERHIAGLPGRDADIPPFPPAAETDQDLKRAWKRTAARAHDENRKNMGRRLQAAQTAAIARKFADRRAIWFPHQMDFRGRIYPLPTLLNPQGPDYAKALLTFARGYPINDDVAAGWLMIAGANRYGKDKCSLTARMDWVLANEEAVLSAARDPWGPAFDFWSTADDPFQFLAWAFEWAAFKEHGWGFVSSLPVALDGTCNGLQHYSAALRDPEGGAAVNLLPGDKPNDIYGVVAKRTEELAKEFLRPDGPGIGRIKNLDRLIYQWGKRGLDAGKMAVSWLALGLDRKIVKRAVMTLPYGSTTYSAREFLEEAAKEKLGKGIANPFTASQDPVEVSRSLFNASLWLQPLVWQAIGETVKAAREGMDWLQACAKDVCALGLPVSWRTPDGFLVQQAYRSWDKHQVATVLDGSRIRLTVAEVGLEVDKRAQQQGIAPNWVHSMDATALRMFVNMAAAHDLHDYALVHDSYGAPAAKVELMTQLLKEAFVQLYTEFDPVMEFYFDMLDQLPPEGVEALPQPPKKGDLDVTQVRQSDYFFA